MKLQFLAVLLLLFQQSQAIRCFTDYNVFFLPKAVSPENSGPYLECFFELDGPTCKKYFQNNSYFIGAQITISIAKENKIIGFKKIDLSFPLNQDTEHYLAIERIPISNGLLDLEIEILDLGDSLSTPLKMTDQLEVLNLDKGAFFSDIQWVGGYSITKDDNPFSKSGMDILPHLSDVFQKDEKNLNAYFEIYNTDQYFGSGAFVYSYEIQDKMGKSVPGTLRIKRESSMPVIPVLIAVNLESISAGEYVLLVELKDKENQLILQQKKSFIRLGNQAGIDETAAVNSFAAAYKDSLVLYEHIRSLQPIAQNIEKSMIEGMAEYPIWRLQGFFYQFWYKRNPMSPETAWRNYEQEVKACQLEFGTKIKKGWETDRGRIYLQYGKPSTRVIRNNDPDYWPFEIWHYYQTNNNLHNKRFLFYNTSLNGDMELLHTDVPNEITNFDWKNLVRSRQMNDPSTVSRIRNNQRQDPYSGDELESLWYNPH
jgi:GWxTD domain-containing protein